jgi:hypothetical protein
VAKRPQGEGDASMTDFSKGERLRGGNQVQIVRMDDTKVAIVFTMGSKEDADHLERNALDGLARGEFKMRLRGKVSSIKKT